MADEREQQIRERLEARIALAEYDKIPVRDLVEGIADGDVDRYADLMESVRRKAWGDYPDADLAYLLEENERWRTEAAFAGGAADMHAERASLMERERDTAWSALAAAREESKEAHRSYETLKRSFDLCVADASQMSGHIEEMADENERLREALLKRGDHAYMCMAKFNDGPCSCGWNAERAALAREDGGNG